MAIDYQKLINSYTPKMLENKLLAIKNLEKEKAQYLYFACVSGFNGTPDKKNFLEVVGYLENTLDTIYKADDYDEFEAKKLERNRHAIFSAWHECGWEGDKNNATNNANIVRYCVSHYENFFKYLTEGMIKSSLPYLKPEEVYEVSQKVEEDEKEHPIKMAWERRQNAKK
jgi:hypothetical protein